MWSLEASGETLIIHISNVSWRAQLNIHYIMILQLFEKLPKLLLAHLRYAE